MYAIRSYYVSIASAAVFSKIALPEMKRHHYDAKFSLGIVATSARITSYNVCYTKLLRRIVNRHVVIDTQHLAAGPAQAQAELRLRAEQLQADVGARDERSYNSV